MSQTTSSHNDFSKSLQALSEEIRPFVEVLERMGEEIRPFVQAFEQIGKALNESEFGAFLRWYQSIIATGKPPA